MIEVTQSRLLKVSIFLLYLELLCLRSIHKAQISIHKSHPKKSQHNIMKMKMKLQNSTLFINS